MELSKHDETIDALCSAIDAIIENWQGGDLAGSVNNARELVTEIRREKSDGTCNRR